MNPTLLHIKNVYMLGIGGIGMSALARWFKAKGANVAGYDRSRTPLTFQLESEGIEVHFEEDTEKIPASFLEETQETLYVFTPAIPAEHQELNFLKTEGKELHKRSEVLGMISNDYPTIAVAGTHGKTTTSSMIAHILKQSGKESTAFLGGIATNYESNLIMNEGEAKDKWIVAEADEYDRSFLRLNPDLAVITAVEADHLDIYGSDNSVNESFNEFANKLPKEGHLFIQIDHADKVSLQKGQKHTYGIEAGDFQANNIRVEEEKFCFDFLYKEAEREQKLVNMTLQIPGSHNVENATVACAIALQVGVEPEEIKSTLASYAGVKRRFEYVLRGNGVTYIDDYAHHPTEIEAFIGSLRMLYPKKKLTVVFQPHLFSRTRDFAEGFAKSLSLADELIMMDIYPAREEPIEGVSSQMILDQVDLEKKVLVKDEYLLEELANSDLDVLATVGAGDIDRFVQPIKELLEKKIKALK